MKRRELIRHLEKEGCVLWREGKKHTVYYNPEKGNFSTIPRHAEILGILAIKICKDLGIHPPK